MSHPRTKAEHRHDPAVTYGPGRSRSGARSDITEKDIFGARRGKLAKQKTVPVEAKYRDPKTGVTWSGRGRAPAWIKDAKNWNRFLIEE